MSKVYLTMSAWNEILARTFDGFHGVDNISPDWLLNPATQRRLKLDRYYPDIGVAIRFIGLKGKNQRRQSDWEEVEAQQRDKTRFELCKLNRVQLVIIDPEEDPVKQLDHFITLLFRASRVMAQTNYPNPHKSIWMPALSSARERASQIRSLVFKNPEQMMMNLAESWRDRETGIISQLQQGGSDDSTQNGSNTVAGFHIGQEVSHERFGDGIITGLSGEGDDATISILFGARQQRTFLVNLVKEKVKIR